VTSVVGEFDSRQTYIGTKSPDFSQKEAPDCNGRGLCFGSNGHEMVTNFFVLNFLEVLLVNGTPDLLIKSYSPRLFMPVAWCHPMPSDK